jgi:hypothetical protein
LVNRFGISKRPKRTGIFFLSGKFNLAFRLFIPAGGRARVFAFFVPLAGAGFN